MNQDIVLIGGFSEIIELCNDLGYESIYVIDRKDVGLNTLYIGNDNEVETQLPRVEFFEFCITPDLPKVRKAIFDKFYKYNIRFGTLKSGGSKISKTSKIERGCVIQYGAYISSNVVLSSFVKVNVNACVMHDSKIGSFTTLAPSCTILGRVTIGEMCYIGSSATILPEISICDNVTIGAGAVVTKSISESGTYAGVPARKLK